MRNGSPLNRFLTVVVLALSTPHPTLGLERHGVSDIRAKGPTASEKRSQKRQVAQTLRMMTKVLIQAYPKQEVAVLDRILAEDLTVINPDGSSGDKAGEIASLRSGKLKLASVTNDNIKVRVFGDTAVVTGRATIRGQIDGQTIRDQNRYTSVFVKRRGRWQVIALHVTRVAQQ
jgi:ketosteroid isomerase-like protein